MNNPSHATDSPPRSPSSFAKAAPHQSVAVDIPKNVGWYRALYEDNPSMYFSVAPEGTVLSVNRFGAEQLGYAVEELVGKSVLNVFHSEDVVSVAENLESCLSHPGKVHVWEARKIRKDGSELWVRETCRTIHSPDGRPVVLVVCEDITARTRIENALRLVFDGTSLAVGEEFFPSLVRHLATALSVKICFIAELCGKNNECARLLAMWRGTSFLEPFEYALHGRPCEQVFLGHRAYYPSNVRKQFPKDTWLADNGIESYLAVPLSNPSGERVGHLGVMDNSEMSSDTPRESILGVFAARAGAELERKRSQEALQSSEERFRNYFKLQSIGIAISSSDKLWLEINEELCNILGYSREELLGRPWTEFTHPDDLEACFELFGRAVAGSVDDYSLDKRFIRKDGSIVHVKLSVRCLRKPDGTLDYCLVLYEDVTERLKAQTALRRYEQIVSASSDLLAFLDATYTYQAVNSAYAEAFGKTKEDIVGRKVSEVISSEVYLARIKPHLDLCLSGRRVSFQHWLDLPGKGRRCLDMHYDPFYEADGALSGIVADIRDITERKEAAKKLRQYQDRLRTLASRISFVEERERRRIGAELHDRTLQRLGLAKIKLGTIRADTSFAGRLPDLEHVYELVDQSIQDTRALVFDLSPPVLYELGFEPAIEWLAESVQERGIIRCEVHQQEQRVSLGNDVEIALFQSVRELLVNIEKHANASKATVTLELEHNAIHVCVEDDGDGFDVSTLRTHSTVEGGLGLFGIRERLLLFGGNVGITSNAGVGTRVTLTAPLKPSGGAT